MPYEDFTTTVRKRKLRWYGHITRPIGLAQMTLQDTVQGGITDGRLQKIEKPHVGMDRFKAGRSPL